MIDLIKACTDLGTHVCGAELGPEVLLKDFIHDHIQHIYTVRKKEGEKELEASNRKKNIDRINAFNEELYQVVRNSLQEGNFPIIIGGDHSLAIGSALASNSIYENMGIIWVDAHADYNTFETTITGNIHGIPLATVTGQVPEGLTDFFHGKYIEPQNAVIVGARSIDMPEEWNNLKKAGVKVYLEEDVNRLGINRVMEEAFEIASIGTNGVHVSLDVDVIDPTVAPGVSIPEINGFTEKEFQMAVDRVIDNRKVVKSIDLVEYNPTYDVSDKTFKIVFRRIKEACASILRYFYSQGEAGIIFQLLLLRLT